MIKCALELAQLPRRRRICRGDKGRRHLIDVDCRLLALRPSYVVDILIVHDREEPSADVAALLPEMSLGDPADERVLHEIIRANAVPRQCPRVAPKSRNLFFDETVKFGH